MNKYSVKEAFEMGKNHFLQGYSKYYNPFRNKIDDIKLFSAWEEGWEKAKNGENKKLKK